MSREDPLKAEKDFSTILDEQFPVIDELAKTDYKAAVDKYLVLEKQTRQSSDVPSSKRVLVKIVTTLVTKDWDLLNDLIVLLSKKHGQLKSSIQIFIQSVIEHLDSLEVDNRVKLIETIRTVTDKKIFVEVERAIVSRKLADIYLGRDELDKAVDVLCDLQVETYSLMKFDDKVEFILEQIRLTLKKGDFAQAKILSRKVLLKTLKNLEKFKVIYLGYLIEINVHENDYISIVKNMLLLIELDEVKELANFTKYLTSIVYYIILSPYDPHQSDLINKIKINPVFKKIPSVEVFQLLEVFTTNELIHWSNIESLYKGHFEESKEIFTSTVNYKNLQNRIIEHNLRIVNQYYQFIKLDRLLYLLQLTADETEQQVCELVNKGMIAAKINRPQGIIKFEKLVVKVEKKEKQSQEEKAFKAEVLSSENHVNELLNEWCYDVDKLLEEVDSIGHLINKEEMMYGIKSA